MTGGPYPFCVGVCCCTYSIPLKSPIPDHISKPSHPLFFNRSALLLLTYPLFAPALFLRSPSPNLLSPIAAFLWFGFLEISSFLLEPVLKYLQIFAALSISLILVTTGQHPPNSGSENSLFPLIEREWEKWFPWNSTKLSWAINFVFAEMNNPFHYCFTECN